MLLIKCLGLEAKVFNGVLDFDNDVFVLDEFFNVVQGKKKREKGKPQCFSLGQSRVWPEVFLRFISSFIFISCCSYQFDF